MENNIDIAELVDSVNSTNIMLKCLEMKTAILIKLTEFQGSCAGPVVTTDLKNHLSTIDAILDGIVNK